MNKHNKGFIKGNRGATVLEYASLIGLISMVSWGALAALGSDANSRLAFIASCKTQTASTNAPNGVAAVVKQGFGKLTSLPNACVFNTVGIGGGSSGGSDSGSNGGGNSDGSGQ